MYEKAGRLKGAITHTHKQHAGIIKWQLYCYYVTPCLLSYLFLILLIIFIDNFLIIEYLKVSMLKLFLFILKLLTHYQFYTINITNTCHYFTFNFKIILFLKQMFCHCIIFIKIFIQIYVGIVFFSNLVFHLYTYCYNRFDVSSLYF